MSFQRYYVTMWLDSSDDISSELACFFCLFFFFVVVFFLFLFLFFCLFFFGFGYFVKIHLVESSKLELKGLCLGSYTHIFKYRFIICNALRKCLLFCILPILTVLYTVLASDVC